MKLGIMQPYFFPYLGYWQLMNLVDKYVIYDDVNYINKGYINRNSILINGQAKSINLILHKASQNKLINQIEIDIDEKNSTKLLRKIKQAYAKAPYFDNVMPMLEDIIKQPQNNLAKYIYYSFEKITRYLNINTELIFSSSLEKDNTLKAHKKIISICCLLDASEYYNSIGGIELYEPYRDEFEKKGIRLKFLKSNAIRYNQFGNDFVPNLSIIDVMMFNSKEDISRMLNDYSIV